jgi:uncharacterized repeat protein (TIGR03806 family)
VEISVRPLPFAVNPLASSLLASLLLISGPSCVGEIKRACSTCTNAQSENSAGAVPEAPAAPTTPCHDCGLDERPHNQTCRALTPPALLAELQPAFPKLPNTTEPVLLARPADGHAWYLFERRGIIRRFDDRPDVDQAPVILDMSTAVDPSGDAGLVGAAFHPDFAHNGQLFISHTTPGGTVQRSQLARLTSTDGGATFDLAGRKLLLDLDQEDPGRIHLNADLHFGPDGFLYAGFGDGGPQWDLRKNAQNSNDWRGKILRIDVDHGDPYGIPPGNPYAKIGGRPEIFALGLRNPWRFSFDRTTGTLWAGDVGNGGVEEIDQISVGGNYGWPSREGGDCSGLPDCDRMDFINPVAHYHHDNKASSVTGGFVYRGHAIPSLIGRYVFADYARGTVFALRPNPTLDQAPEVIAESGRRLVSFAEEPNGELLLLDLMGGQILRLVPAAPSQDMVPERLSNTGCFQAGNPQLPAAGVISYDVRVPFWSAGGVKHRYMALPDGATATVAADGALQFPVGAVLIKEFTIDSRPVETRLFMKYRESQWAGYSYVWEADGSDAHLRDDALVETRDWDGQSWTYPSRVECLGCHNGDRGLGLEVAQLDMVRAFPETGRTANQLASFRRVGLVQGDVPKVQRMPKLSSAAPLEERARAYMHINCAICHTRPGPTPIDMDLRFTTLLADTGLCDIAKEGDLGVAGARRLVAGAPGRSVISLRMHATGRDHMPPIGAQQADPEGEQLIDSWISSIQSCPPRPTTPAASAPTPASP